MRKTKLVALLSFLTLTASAMAQNWEWSSGLNTYYYRDNDGRVHYGDGSVSEPSTTWTNSEGKTVYSANSAGPADKTGQYAIQAPRVDESSIGAAPTSPPAGYVATRPGANGQPVFGGTDPNQIIYVPPNSQGNGNVSNDYSTKPSPVFGPVPAASSGAVFGPINGNGQSYQVIVGPNGENIYYFQGSNGENIYYTK